MILCTLSPTFVPLLHGFVVLLSFRTSFSLIVTSDGLHETEVKEVSLFLLIGRRKKILEDVGPDKFHDLSLSTVVCQGRIPTEIKVDEMLGSALVYDQ